MREATQASRRIPTTNFNCLFTILVLLAFHQQAPKVSASMNPNEPLGGDFSYFDVDLSSDCGEDESGVPTDVPDPLLVKSEIHYCTLTSDDEECYVASETYMDEESVFFDSQRASSSMDQLELSWFLDDERFNSQNNDYADDDEDDNDDDDGGHSSMLSNDSVRNRRRHTETSLSVTSTDKTKPPKQALAKLRGGATAPIFSSMLKSDLSKKLFVTALVTLVYEGCIGHILEFLKICMQTAQGDTTYLDVIKSITSEKGISGLWDGFVPWGVVQAICKGAVFGIAHAAASKYLKPLAEDGTIPLALALTLAGGIGGGFQGYVLSPTLLLKTRVMTNPVFREKMSLLRTTLLSFRIGADVVKREGIVALMKGSNVFAVKRVFDWSTRYFFSDLFELLLKSLQNGTELSVVQQSMASLMGGVASTCATLPLDVLVAKTQDAKKAGVKVSALELFIDELKEKGVDGLRHAYLRGFTARLLHVCLTTAAVKNGTPLVYDFLFNR